MQPMDEVFILERAIEMIREYQQRISSLEFLLENLEEENKYLRNDNYLLKEQLGYNDRDR